MGLTQTQAGIITASISGGVIVIVCASLLYFGQNLPFTFSRSNPPCTDAQMRELGLEAQRSESQSSVLVEGKYSQYGVL